MTEGGPTAEGPDGPAPGRDVGVPTLLGDQYGAFDEFLSGGAAGPLAVVGPPFGGRDAVLEAAAERLGVTPVRLDPGDGSAELPKPGSEPVVVDDCQHLYRGAIDGFEPVERFLGSLAGADAPVVTGWNRYAWGYLTAVRDIEGAFPARVDVGPVATEAIAERLLERYDETPRFLPDDARTDGLVTTRRYSIEWRDRTVALPVPVPNPVALGALRGGTDPDPEDVVFERLAAVSDGNAGVATAIRESRRSGELRPSDVVAAGADVDLDHDEAFRLRIVLAKERVERAELAEILGDRPDRILGRLGREGLVTSEGNPVCLEPGAVPSVVTATDRGQIL